MSSPYSYNSLGRQERPPGSESGRLGSQSSGSQQNLTGTLNRTQVERRPAQFISARSRLDSSDSHLGDRGGGGTLKRTGKSQERLNSTSSSLGGSRGNLSNQRSASGSRGNLASQPQPQYQNQVQPQPQSHQYHSNGNQQNYSNIPNYSNISSITSSSHFAEKEDDDFDLPPTPKGGRDVFDSNVQVQAVQSYSYNSKPFELNYSEFEKIRKDCLRKGQLYDDPDYLPGDTALYYSRNPPYVMEWFRAKKIAMMYRQPAKFVAGGFDRFDIRQGTLGDCWFLAAAACLTSIDHRSLFDQVVPPNQNFDDGWYAGIFHFNFWHFGKWKQIFIDDFLPTVRNQLIFVKSIQTNEFWASLMEKAYAKLYGSYEALKGGALADALTDLTGGISETYRFHGENANVPGNIINILFKALERLSLIGCAIDDKGSGQAMLPNGLVAAHAYTVTDLRRILSGQVPVNLIRIRNPHGDNKEWRGRWGERSQEWQQISPSDRERLGLIQRDDGEFWMEFDDFIANFDTLTICSLTPDSPLDVQRKWHIVEHDGRWIRGFNAGGRPYSDDTFYTNPQYFLRLEDADEDEDNTCSVIVQLMQKDRRRMKQRGEKFYFIGFMVYAYDKTYPVPLKKDFFDYNRRIADSGAFTNTRQVTKRLELPVGEYVVVPCTWDADEEADFYIRFFFEKGNVAEYLDDKPEKIDVPTPPVNPEMKEQEETFKEFFYRVSGEDMEVNAFELRDAIIEGWKNDALHTEVSIGACRSFVNLMDVDGSGLLSFVEFQNLWNYLRHWKKTFYQFDKDNSGMLNSRELRAALGGLGYKVPSQTIAHLIHNFADEKSKISLDSFFTLVAKVKKAFNVFQSNQKDNKLTFTLGQWLGESLTV